MKPFCTDWEEFNDSYRCNSWVAAAKRPSGARDDPLRVGYPCDTGHLPAVVPSSVSGIQCRPNQAKTGSLTLPPAADPGSDADPDPAADAEPDGFAVTVTLAGKALKTTHTLENSRLLIDLGGDVTVGEGQAIDVVVR